MKPRVDLNAVVAEYVDRGIPFTLHWDRTGAVAEADGVKAYAIETGPQASGAAMKKALTAYLKKHRSLCGICGTQLNRAWTRKHPGSMCWDCANRIDSLSPRC
jgi:hypothetical protein